MKRLYAPLAWPFPAAGYVLRMLSGLLILAALWAPAQATADELTVAAAADLTFAFKDVAARFRKETGNTVKLSFGSSGNFFSQLRNGAPYDLFFSADIDYPKKLAAAGLTEPGSLYEYATGKIVLWVPNASALDLKRGLKVLLDPQAAKTAIANPLHAPYGKAAVAALKHEKIYDRVKPKLVLGENIAQTAQFVQSGSAQIGILALSLARAPTLKDQGRYAEIPAADYPPIEQAGVILKSSHQQMAARQFMSFIQKPEIVRLLNSYGLSLPKGDAAKSGDSGTAQ
jgi:molybdate transport system substrate-binding protein